MAKSRNRVAAVAAVIVALCASLLGAVPAAAAGIGVVEGIVRDSAGRVVENVEIEAVPLDGGTVRVVNSDEQGFYRVANLTAGSYRLFFGADGAGADLLSQYYDRARLARDAETVTIVDGGVTTVDAVLQRAATIAGVVRADDSFDPVPDIDVVAYRRTATGLDWAAGTMTEADGTYALTGLWPGEYLIHLEPMDSYVQRWWPEAADSDGAVAVSVGEGDRAAHIDGSLAEAGVVSGRVIDGDGDPVPLTTVRVYATDEVDARATGRTDENGDYAVRGLESDEYVVEFEAPYGSGLRDQWWQGAGSREEATVVPLWAASAAGIDARLEQGSAFAGTLTDALGPVSGVPVFAFPADCSETVVGVATARTDADGRYELAGLAPGSYRVRFGEEGMPGHAPRWYGGAACSSATVLATGDATTPAVDGVLGETLTGTVRGAANAPIAAAPVTVYLVTSGGRSRVGHTLTSATGVFSMPGLPAGSYAVSFGEGGLPGTYRAEWWKDAADAATAAPIVVTAGRTPPALAATLDLTPVSLATPTVSGTPRVGVTLSAPSAPSGVTFAYQWFANGAAVAKATSRTFVPPASHVGKALAVRITASRTGYAPTTRTSASTTAVRTGVLTRGTPTVSGTPAVGRTLTAAAGRWSAGTTLRFQWYADGRAIRGATRATLVPATAQRGATITVRVTGSRTGYATAASTSAATRRVAVVGTPRVSGTLTVGKRLTAQTGTWTTGTSFRYQWYANGRAIPRATGATLLLSRSLKGKTIAVKVTGRKSGYPTVTVTARGTRKVG